MLGLRANNSRQYVFLIGVLLIALSISWYVLPLLEFKRCSREALTKDYSLCYYNMEIQTIIFQSMLMLFGIFIICFYKRIAKLLTSK